MRWPLFCFFIAAAFLVGVPVQARDAGWVPIPKEKWQPPLKPGEQPKTARATKRAITGDAAPGSSVYSKQKPVTEAELLEFCELLPRFRSWARQNHEEARPVVNARGEADISYSPQAAQWLRDNNFAPARFFCIMGKMASCLFIIAEGNDFGPARPKDMPKVQESEIALARRHLGELLTAGGVMAPIH